MNSMRANRRIAVAVVLAATMARGGAAVADEVTDTDAELGRIAWTDGTLTLDPADRAHRVQVGRAGTRDGSAPGWDTTGVPEGAVAGDTVRWSLAGLEGPGEVKVYAGDDDAPVFDSGDTRPDVRELPVGDRDETRWEFSEEGTYQVIFEADATAADGRDVSVGTVYTVTVGDTAPSGDASAGETAEEPAPAEAAVETSAAGNSASADAVERTGSVTSQASESAAAGIQAAAALAASDDDGDGDVVSDRKVLDEGHVDFAARVVDGKMQIHLKDGTVAGQTVWREPSSVVLHVKPAAKNTIPDNDQFAFLGEAGAPVWLLDQVQQEGLLWPGWSTDNIAAGTTEGDVTFSLTEAEGPGACALYTYDAMSGATVLFDSGDGTPDSFAVAQNTHAHGGWAFTAEGTYRLTFRMSGELADGTAVSDTETVTFVVGDTDPSTVSPGDGSGEGSDGASGSTGSAGSGETSGSGGGSGADSSGGSASDGSGGSMASTGAGGIVPAGSVAAGLTVAGVLSLLAARRRRNARG